MRKLTLIAMLAALFVGLVPAVAGAKNDPGTDRELVCDSEPTVTVDPHGRVVFPRHGGTASVTITIETDDGVRTCEVVEYAFASYTAEGPTWPTSGHQRLVGSDILSTRLPGVYKLVVAVPNCFFQMDLWVGTYVPTDIIYPDFGTPAQLISAENGGEGDCDEPGPGPGPSPTPEPEPEPEPVNHPRASINGPTCDDRTFDVTLNNEHSDEPQVFILKLNGKTHRAIEVQDGRTVQITVHADDGDRLQVFTGAQLAETDASFGRDCNEPKHRTHNSTDNGNERKSPTTRVLANTGAETGPLAVLFIVLLILGAVSLWASKKRGAVR